MTQADPPSAERTFAVAAEGKDRSGGSAVFRARRLDGYAEAAFIQSALKRRALDSRYAEIQNVRNRRFRTVNLSVGISGKGAS